MAGKDWRRFPLSLNRLDDISVKNELSELLKERILIVDGAMGTTLESLNPSADDFGGEHLIGCNEMLNLNAPHLVEKTHKSFIDVGVDIIETNSFNGSPVVLAEYGIVERARELARLSAEIACYSVEKYASERHVFVMGSMGPGTKSITVTGGVTFDQIREAYMQYAAGLLEGGADILVLETVQDTLNLKAGLMGVKDAQRELNREAPVAVSVTIEIGGTMLAGQNIEALYHTLSGFDLFSIGLNCAVGPEMMSDHLRTLSRLSRFPVSIWPNAGLPDEWGNYSEHPESFAEKMGRFAREGYINIVGGCCGTTTDHIRAISEAVAGISPRSVNVKGIYPALTGAEAMVVESDNRPVFIGERTNTIGSRKFKRLIDESRWDEAAEIGSGQVRRGAMVIDLCTADPDREEVDDYLSVLKPLLRKVRVPILIDTIDPGVVEAAFKTIGGKPAVNSVNLEDGGDRLRQIAALAREYGASLVCGLIDDDPESGMAVTLNRKMEVAGKIYHILKDEFSLPDQDIIFDSLVFPAGTGDAAYYGAASETIEAVRKIKETYPDCLTILGISNVSFGLPAAGREVVNSVFLYECTKAGLDMAIVNTQRLKRYPSIPDNEIKLAEDLLFRGNAESISALTNHFRGVTVSEDEDIREGLSVEEKLIRAVVEARKTGLENNLDDMLKSMPPLEIINSILMRGMKEVGGLFADNKLIVAEVLESAEVMKTAVDYLRGFFPAGASPHSRGKMLLATVKGDVHDIGKNLVDMILSNNGFDVVDLGIKVAPQTLIDAVRREKPDMIGLSGLLVRSAQQMVHTAVDLTAAGIDIPLLVGGAALTKKFAKTRIAPEYRGQVFYASDAMDGLSLAGNIVDKEQPSVAVDEPVRLGTGSPSPDSSVLDESAPTRDKSAPTRGEMPHWIETDVPPPPDLDEHLLESLPVDEVYKYINLPMLFGKHLGVRELAKRRADPADEQLKKLQRQVEDVFEEAVKESVLAPRAVYRWFKAWSEGEHVFVQHPETGIVKKFGFPRQESGERLSAVDWLRPLEKGGDSLAMFVVTSGPDTAPRAAQMREDGKLLASHILQALALELSGAAAEWLHKRLRSQWGIPDPNDFTLRDMFSARYRGVRLSFGYPACPDIEDQAGLFELLKPERIGVTLTEGYMMHPESSVSAVGFHHPSGRYYCCNT
ncbi:methionine synthase [bacterium]|nr:methionine synthase [bacterium]